MTKRPDYYDMMKRPTDGTTWDRLEERYGQFETQSTFKKPYQEDEYPEMEFFYPDIPGMPYTPPGLPYPFWPYDDGEEYPEYSSGPCGPCVVRCIPTVANYECGEEVYGQCYAMRTCFIGGPGRGYASLRWVVKGDPILRVERYKTSLCTGELVRNGGYCIKIFPKWDDIEAIEGKKSANYTVVLFDGWKPEEGTYASRCESKIEIRCKEECCPAETTFQYGLGNAETIARESTETICVLGGCAPYSWTVSGTGFSLAYSSTENRQNDLIADDTACGTAIITITDDCGTSITGYVRCTTGTWSSCKIDNVTGTPCGGCSTNGEWHEKINGTTGIKTRVYCVTPSGSSCTKGATYDPDAICGYGEAGTVYISDSELCDDPDCGAKYLYVYCWKCA